MNGLAVDRARLNMASITTNLNQPFLDASHQSKLRRAPCRIPLSVYAPKVNRSPWPVSPMRLKAFPRHLFGWITLMVASAMLTVLPTRVLAQTTSVVGDTSLASLQAAVGIGGTFYLAATGTVAVTSTLIISKDTVLMNTNRSIVISGGDYVTVTATIMPFL